MTGSGATKMWYDEIKDYNFSKPAKYNPKCGHFTQVVWVGSTELGAGFAKSKSGATYVVARYSPAGNMLTKFDENVLPAGSRVSSSNNVKPSSKSNNAKPSSTNVTSSNLPSSITITIKDGKVEQGKTKRVKTKRGMFINIDVIFIHDV